MFGNVLKELRREENLTQEELAHRADLHRTYISLLERDEKSPTLKVVFKLARALRIRPSTLLLRVEDRLPNSEIWWREPRN